MKTAIISDVHSNLEALLVVKAEIDKANVDQIYCLGDIVGYNANPRECLKLIREMNAICVAGNHDYAAIGLTDIEYFNPHAKVAALWSGKQLQEEDKSYIKKLPLVRKIGNFTLVHATLREPELWGYILSTRDAQDCFSYQETPLCFIGHSHYPSVFEEGGKLILSPEMEIKLNKDSRYIINVGSVGQPRDRNPKASFVFFDTEQWVVDFRRLDYDIEKTQEKVLAAGLPPFLAERLAVGR